YSTTAWVTLSTALSVGAHQLYATASGPGGSSPCSTAHVDYTVLALPVPSGVTLTSPASSPGTDPNPTVQVAGVGSDMTVKIYSDSACTSQVGSATSYGSTASVTLSPALAVGTYTFYASTANSAGSSACSTAHADYSLLPPPVPSGITITSPASSPGTDPTPTFQVTGVGNNMTVKVYSDSSCTTQVASASSFGATATVFTSTPLAVAAYTFYARTTNANGSSACSTANVSYDLQASPTPTVSLTYPASISHYSTHITVTVGSLPTYGSVGLYSDSSCSTLVASGSGSGNVAISLNGLTAGAHSYWGKITTSTDLTASACSVAALTYTVVARTSFAAVSGHALPNTPGKFVVADFNNDGKLDVIVPMTNGSSAAPMYFYAGNGDTTFQTPASLGTYIGVNGIASGDVNGDGDLDLVIVRGTAKTASVLLGNGDGTFAAPVSYAAGPSTETPMGVTLSDLDNDGNPDLITIHSGSSTGSLWVRKGIGDGTFGAQTSYAVQYNLFDVRVADVNHDSKPDLVVDSYYSSSLSVLLGVGDGTLQAKVSYSGEHGSGGAALGDLDGDGFADIIQSAANTGNELAITLNNGDGTFKPMSTVQNFSGSFMSGLDAGDIDGDGHDDVIVTHSGFNKVSVSYGDGSGTVAPAEYFALSGSTGRVKAVDLDGDGDLDLVVTTTGSLDVLKNLRIP
ncbi:MAG TPA: VCBS repeat-containing protein, partial [Bdellovibrionota bacterium]|nr:VCBS repeat-containing protein [Bdellovibrionota bacterium]